MPSFFIGVGNLHRGDDAVGPLMAERLRDRLTSVGVEVLAHGGEGVSLMQIWEGAEKVVVVDAMKSGAALGRVRRFDVATDKLGAGVFRYSSHLFGLAEAVEMARALGKLPKEMIIFGIEGAAFDFDTQPAKAVNLAARVVEKDVLAAFGAE